MKKVLVFLSLLFLGLAAWLVLRPAVEQPDLVGDKVPQRAEDKGRAEEGSPATASPSSPGDSKAAASEFSHFLRTEARSLGATGLDPEVAQKRVEEVAGRMGPVELGLAREAVFSAAAANERIFAMYLLTAAGPKAWESLREVVSAPLKVVDPEPHSLDEMQGMQEKALRIMAIDSLAEQAAAGQAARDLLQRLSTEVTDTSLRQYILKKLRGLPPL
jgi:hypothetical protein